MSVRKLSAYFKNIFVKSLFLSCLLCFHMQSSTFLTHVSQFERNKNIKCKCIAIKLLSIIINMVTRMTPIKFYELIGGYSNTKCY